MFFLLHLVQTFPILMTLCRDTKVEVDEELVGWLVLVVLGDVVVGCGSE